MTMKTLIRSMQTIGEMRCVIGEQGAAIMTLTKELSTVRRPYPNQIATGGVF